MNLYYVDDKSEADQTLHVVASTSDAAIGFWRDHYEIDESEEPSAVFLVLSDVDTAEGPLGWTDKVQAVWRSAA